ncbi:MAG: molybdopterin oxidoreductase family protein, partial [Rhodospirillaceae bacterium]
MNQSASGSDKVNAIINVHLATGRIGRPGMGPFSVTGQPNAMGGREVGGLANQLAAHMDPDNPTHVDRVRRFWDAPALQQGQGLKAVDMFKAIGEGKIKLVWVMATNPAVSLPASAKVREALETCPTVIVSDVTAETDTAAYADILLPAAGWGEKDGTVTNSERCISRQRGFRPPVGEAKPDWWALTQVAHRLGFERAFAYDSPVDVFVEHAALSAFENDGERAFDIGGLIDLDRAAYDALEPIRWPVPAPSAPKQPLQGAGRLFAEGGFTHPDGKAKLLPVQHRPLKEAVDERFDLVLNTGRYRDQWHTMTRTGLSARLSAHRPEPLLEVNPEDAAARGMAEDQVVSLHSVHGTVMARLRLTANQPRGQVFLPIHWTDAFASDAITSRLIAPHVDPLSGQPESKASPVRLEALGPVREGIAFTKSALRPEGVLRWARVEGSDAVATHLVLDCTQNAIDGLPERPADLTYEDPQRGSLSSVW